MWFAEAPSNIALIKYMGKHGVNLPCNKSLSYTIDRFTSRVELEIIDGKDDKFAPLEMVGHLGLNISEFGVQKFLKHLAYLKLVFGCGYKFLVKSANNFPNDTGIASSASSFAALTMCAIQAFCDIQKTDMPSASEMSKLSREGSGSSCRSFFRPWAVWDNDRAYAIDLPMSNLKHRLALIDSSPKKVSSSAAHAEVRSSLLFNGRAERAERRFSDLVKAIEEQDWHKMFVISWQEFFDMHAMFYTSRSPFWYMTPETMNILQKVQQYWDEHKDGPVVTVDAGPNIHFLWRQDQDDMLDDFFENCEFVLM